MELLRYVDVFDLEHQEIPLELVFILRLDVISDWFMKKWNYLNTKIA